MTKELVAHDHRDHRRAILRRYFGIARPRIAVTGLNPHAGEDGGLGREEIDVIAPAIEAARVRGLDVTGPHPADTLFHAAARATYDVAICMYHDQALVPVQDARVRRTASTSRSDCHSCAPRPITARRSRIAGTGKASPRSLIEALAPGRCHAVRQRGAQA